MATTADLEETIEPARAYSVKDISAHEFVVKYAAWLRKSGKLPVPKWVDIVKTGSHKELAPYGDDWYYVRAGELPRRPPLCRVRSCRRAPLPPLAPSLACARGCARRPGQRVAVRARGRGAVSTR